MACKQRLGPRGCCDGGGLNNKGKSQKKQKYTNSGTGCQIRLQASQNKTNPCMLHGAPVFVSTNGNYYNNNNNNNNTCSTIKNINKGGIRWCRHKWLRRGDWCHDGHQLGGDVRTLVLVQGRAAEDVSHCEFQAKIHPNPPRKCFVFCVFLPRGAFTSLHFPPLTCLTLPCLKGNDDYDFPSIFFLRCCCCGIFR